jgi:type IV secretion system protein VirD4
MGLLDLFFGREQRRQALKNAFQYAPENISGAARFASDDELDAAGCFDGGLPVAHTMSGDEIYLPSGHLACFGRTGCGKTSIFINMLLNWQHSAVVLDPMGDISCTTAHYRKRFGPVYVINPYLMFQDELKGIRHIGYNPMARRILNPDSLGWNSMCGKLAEPVHAVSHHGNNRYFDVSGRGLVQGVSMGESRHGRRPSLRTVAARIKGDPFDYARFICKRTSDRNIIDRLGRFTGENAEDIRSLSEIIEGARTEVDFLCDEAIENVITPDDIAFADLKRRVITVYVMLPFKLSGDQQGKLLSVITAMALAELYDGKGRVPVLMMLDELRQYGGPISKPLVGAFTGARKYGVRLVGAFPDYCGLREIFPDTHETVLNQCSQQWLSASDKASSEYLSSMCGETEVHAYNKSVNYGADDTFPETPSTEELAKLHVNHSWTQKSRKVMLPHEIRQIPRGHQILLLGNVERPIYAQHIHYTETEMGELARPNPFEI